MHEMRGQRQARGSRGIEPGPMEAAKDDRWFETRSDASLVYNLLMPLSANREELLAQEGPLGDRLRQAWANYCAWSERYGQLSPRERYGKRSSRAGWTPLMIAAAAGHNRIVYRLLASGAEVDCADSNG